MDKSSTYLNRETTFIYLLAFIWGPSEYISSWRANIGCDQVTKSFKSRSQHQSMTEEEDWEANAMKRIR